MASQVVRNSRLNKAIESVDSWDNEEPFVIVRGSLAELKENAQIVKKQLTPNAKGFSVWMQMCARFEYRFGVQLD